MKILRYLGNAALLICVISAAQAQRRSVVKPTALQCDSLTTPLGDDSKAPLFSWKLQDDRPGAKQSAYRILVAKDLNAAKKGTGDVWDSGRVTSEQSIAVPYAGPALLASTRYYWRVQTWDGEGHASPMSEVSWWETGLIDASNWSGKWIGYEDPEHHALREAGAVWVTNPIVKSYKGESDTRHQFRLAFDVPKQVKKATLYATGEDASAAWVNGKQVLSPSKQPPWGRLPWRTYASSDVTTELHAGKNLLAIEITLYRRKDRSQTPMNSSLYVEMEDGTSEVLKTGTGMWKSAFNETGAWYSPQFNDDSWAAAEPYPLVRDAFGGPVESMGSPLQTDPIAVLRREFQVLKPVVSARLYATALGAYRCKLNGKQVGDHILSPGWTDYRQRVTYQTFDVTSLVQQGRNAIGASLASGWYATPLEWVGQGNNYGLTAPALKAQLRLQYADGSVEWVATDESWKAAASPILSAEIYNGETYDARKFQPGWDSASFSDAQWNAAGIVHPHEPEIVAQSFQPIRETMVLPAKTVASPKAGVYVYDFGQEIAGVVKLKVSGKSGTDVQLRFAEILNSDGTLYVDNLRNAKATDHYILSGKGVEEYQPTFTFHGFRYLEISGLTAAPALGDVKAVVMHTDAPITASLKTGSPLVNQLWSNILWGQRSNFVGVPTDCPQRDERLGWSADAQVFWRTASFNMDLAAFSRKYARDLRGTQSGTAMYGIYAPGTTKPNPGYGPGWSDAGVIVPWTSWIQTGDATIIDQNWEGMERYLAAIEADNPDHLWKKNSGIAFGDWLSPEGSTSEELIATAYWAYNATLMRQMAHARSRTEDEHRYAELFEKIKTAFNSSFVHADGVVGPISSALEAKNAPEETQTGYVLALHMNLLPEAARALAAKRLVGRIEANNWRLGTGFLGTPYLLEVLADTGHADVAYRLLLNTEYPSWGYMVEHGATTTWERWNGDKMLADPGMNSFDHYAYGAVAEWIYRYAAGVDTVPEDAGFHTIFLHPNFDARLGNLDFSYDSSYGVIHSAWSVQGTNATWNVSIPANSKARMILSTAEAQNYTVGGQALSESKVVKVTNREDGKGVYDLPSGTYNFTVSLSHP